MRKIFSALVPIAFATAALAATLVAFSYTRSYSATLGAKQQSGLAAQGALSDKTALALDADTLLGSNLTKIASQVFAESILAQNPQGPRTIASGTVRISLDENATAAQMFGAAMDKVLQEIPRFSDADLKIVADTPESNQAYAQKFIAGVNQYLKPFRGKDILKLAYEANTNNDAQARKDLVAYIDASQAMIQYLESVPVPTSWTAIEILYLNILSQARYTALALLAQQSDPLRANIMTRSYPALLSQVKTTGDEIQTNMKKLGYAI